MSALSQEYVSLAPTPTPNASAPVFIVGPGRSGTTLLARILNKHRDVAILPETWMFVVLDRLGCLEGFADRWQYSLFMNRLWRAVEQFDGAAAAAVALEAASRPAYAGPTKEVLLRIGERYSQLRRARIWGEKTPGHVLWLPHIRQTFPDARVLMMIRDPRDVIVSYCERWNHGRFDAAYVMQTAALVRHYFRYSLRPPLLQEQVRWVRYESLTSKPSELVSEICSFLGIPFEAEMLDFYRDYNQLENASADGEHHKLLSEPVTTKHVGRFRRAFSPSLLKTVEDFLGDELEQVGYTREANKHCTISNKEAIAREGAARAYRNMASGKIRRRARRRSQAKVWLCRVLGPAVKALPRVDFAISGEDWHNRATLTSADSQTPLQFPKKPSESQGIESDSSRSGSPAQQH